MVLIDEKKNLYEAFRNLLCEPFEIDYATAGHKPGVSQVLKLLELTFLYAVVTADLAIVDKLLAFGRQFKYRVEVTN